MGEEDADLFEFERQVAPMVATNAQQLTAEQRERDVFDSHRHRVFSVAFYMTANELEAESILAETFVRVFSTSGPRSGEQVDRALVDELSERFALETAETATPDVELLLERASNRRTALEEALPSLTPLERLVFLLRDVEGYSSARIAPLVQLPEPEVQRTVLSARIRMRNELAMAQVRARHAALTQDGNEEEEEAES
jgi:DNA-directed RNA polymerase specialized sigma24 family protein